MHLDLLLANPDIKILVSSALEDVCLMTTCEGDVAVARTLLSHRRLSHWLRQVGCDTATKPELVERGLQAGLRALTPLLKLAGLSADRLVVHKHVYAKEVRTPTVCL